MLAVGRRRLFGAFALSLVPFVATHTASGQTPGGPGGGAPQNLKVLPKDIPRDSLLRIMRGFALSLGVRCPYCHVSEPGPNGQERLRPAADDKIQKVKARFMLQMTDSINRVVLAALPGRHNPPVRVSCVTCHHGLPIPATLVTSLTSASDTLGADSLVARVRSLRTDATSGRYDLSEVSISDAARVLAERGKTAEAVALLQLDQEFYPQSPDIDFQLAELYRQRGEKENAIVRYRAVLAKRPNDQRATQRLRELEGIPITKP